MLREWINSIIVQYNQIQQEHSNRNNVWINFNILIMIVFMVLPDKFCVEYEKNLLEDIKRILLEFFIELDEQHDSGRGRIVGYWPPLYSKKIRNIYLKILCVYSGRWNDKHEQDSFFELLMYYPVLGKLYKVKKNYNIDYNEKAQEILDAFFACKCSLPEESDSNQIISEMHKCMNNYAIANEVTDYDDRCEIDEYCELGYIWEEMK